MKIYVPVCAHSYPYVYYIYFLCILTSIYGLKLFLLFQVQSYFQCMCTYTILYSNVSRSYMSCTSQGT